MAKESFRDILARFLEENDPIPPLKTPPKTEFQASFNPETLSFHWENAKPQPPKHAYSPNQQAFKPKQEMPSPEEKSSGRPAKSAASPAKPAAPPELKWAISSLNAADQQSVKRLVQLGANEISGEISLSSLKKAYRRLARAFHPDTAKENKKAGGPQPSSHQESFLAVQSIYESLSRSLKAKAASESACGNGSASAEASRRQDAA